MQMFDVSTFDLVASKPDLTLPEGAALQLRRFDACANISSNYHP